MEEWRSVVGYEGLYEVSNVGRVRSIDRIVDHGQKGLRRKLKGRMLNIGTSNHGYPIVYLSKNGRVWHVACHILVAGAFIGERPDGYDIHHKNGDKLDNRVCNLGYLPAKEHISIESRGEGNGAGRLKAHQVRKIRELYATGDYRQRALGEMFGVAEGTVKQIVNRRSWKHIKEHEMLYTIHQKT